MRRLSIRARLAAGMVALVAAGLAAVDVSGVLLLRSYLIERVDAQVNAIGPVAAPASNAGQAPSPRQPCTNPRDPQGLRSDFVVLVLDRRGHVECSLGPNLGGDAPDLTDIRGTQTGAGTDTTGTQGGLATVPSKDGGTRWRVRTVPLDDSKRTLVFAVSLADADATVARVTRLSLVVSSLVLLLTAVGAWLIARFGLKPFERIEDTAERIADGDLSERVPDFHRRTEVGRLAHALNGMLGQIERSFNAQTESESRLRRFISDASHELRTPVAAIRGHAELWRTGITDDLDTVMSRIESESQRIGDLVEDMLLLARLDQSRPLQRQPVDLMALATDAILDARAIQPDRHVALEAHPGPTPPIVIGDEARLRQVLANLVANALAHTPTTSPITIELNTIGDQIEIAVSDSGPGMPPVVASKVFDRFYRADPGRTRNHGGSGLGLAIVKSLTEAHGGTVTCTSSETDGSTFAIHLPLLVLQT